MELQLPEGIGLSSTAEIVLFRILQESLTNITRHSGNATVDVHLEMGKDVTTLSVRDYGKGISPRETGKNEPHRFGCRRGIAGMRERLKELGGKLEIQSDSPGTILRASLPVSDGVPSGG